VRSSLSAVRYLALVGVLFGVVAAATAFAWGGVKTVRVLGHIAAGDASGVPLQLVQVMDAFLIAAGLLIFSFGIYELFIGGLSVTRALLIDDLDELKAKLLGVVVMVMAVSFLERLETGEDSRALLAAGASVALVVAALAGYLRLTRAPYKS
jgi:uncharacterized membrane protein YqhA